MTAIQLLDYILQYMNRMDPDVLQKELLKLRGLLLNPARPLGLDPRRDVGAVEITRGGGCR